METSTKEKLFSVKVSGWVAVFLALAFLAIAIYQAYLIGMIYGSDNISVQEDDPIGPGWRVFRTVLSFVGFIIFMISKKSLQMNEAAVYTFMGKYKATLRGPGFFMIPFWWGNYSQRDLSIQNVKVKDIVVNDKGGNPIIIACEIFCSEKDTVAATFNVSDLEKYLLSKGKVTLRHLAMKHHMDAEDVEISLRGDIDKVLKELVNNVAAEYEKAGYEVHSAAITTLTYAPEIAALMLQKQQAHATIAARQKITQGAVEIVEETLKQLEAKGVVTFDLVNKQKLVNSLLVTLCAQHPVTPVLQVSASSEN
jgi:regulator of protease activity HflC (stomatin/prohibitin superfamily)